MNDDRHITDPYMRAMSDAGLSDADNPILDIVGRDGSLIRTRRFTISPEGELYEVLSVNNTSFACIEGKAHEGDAAPPEDEYLLSDPTFRGQPAESGWSSDILERRICTLAILRLQRYCS